MSQVLLNTRLAQSSLVKPLKIELKELQSLITFFFWHFLVFPHLRFLVYIVLGEKKCNNHNVFHKSFGVNNKLWTKQVIFIEACFFSFNQTLLIKLPGKEENNKSQIFCLVP